MAKQTAVSLRNMEVVTIPISDILVDESRNLRRHPPSEKSIRELADSIQAEGGLIHPVTVELNPGPANGNGNGENPADETVMQHGGIASIPPYRLVAGYQRIRALLMLNQETVPAVVREEIDEPASRLTNLRENMDRNELSPIDLAYAIQRLQEDGKLLKDIAKETDRSTAYLSYTVGLLKLSPEIQKRVHDGSIPFKVARDLPKMTEEEQAQAIQRYDSGATAQEVTEGRQAPRRGKKGKKGKGGEGEQEEAGSANRSLSAKAILNELEGMTKNLSEQEKRNKAEERALDLYSQVTRWVTGAIGTKALHNRVMKVLG